MIRPEVTGRKTTTLPQSLDLLRVLSAKEAAELLSVSIATFRRQHWANKLPPPIRLSERRLGWRVRDLLEHFSNNSGTAA